MPPHVTVLLHYLAKRGNAKITFLLSWIVLGSAHTMHMCAVFLKEKVVICDVFDNV